MKELHDTYLGTRKVGTTEVKREGLYYRILCTCQLPDNAMYRLVVNSGGTSTYLGICVPRNSGFETETRIPVKKLGSGDMRFTIEPKDTKQTGNFVPVSETKPFPYLDKLENVRFQIQNGERGVVLLDTYSIDSSSPTGQWSDPIISE